MGTVDLELRCVPLLCGLHHRFVDQLARRTTTRSLAAGDVLVHQGDLGDTLYVVRSGELSVWVRHGVEETRVRRVGPGDVVGETHLLMGGRRTATVRAETAVETLALPRQAFDEVLESDPQLRSSVAAMVADRLHNDGLRASLAVAFDGADVPGLSHPAGWVHLDRGATVPDEPAWFVVVSGELAAPGRLLRRGALFGASDLLPGCRPPAGMTARRPSWLARFDPTVFEQAVRQHPAGLATLRTRSLQPSHDDSVVQDQVVTLCPHTPGRDIGDFVADLALALGAQTPVQIVSPAALAALGILMDPQAVDATHPSWMRFHGWLEAQRLTAGVLLLITEGGTSAWTRMAVDHADRVLLVADAAASPAPGATDRALADRRRSGWAPPCSLALLRPPEAPSAEVGGPDTARWLAWAQVGEPSVLFTASGPTLTVTTPDVEHGTALVFELTATDSEGQTGTAQTTIVVGDRTTSAVLAGDASLLPGDELSLLERIIEAVDDAEVRVSDFVAEIHAADPVIYAAGQQSQFFTAVGLESVLPVVIGDGGLLLAAAHEQDGRRSAAYGSDIVAALNQGDFADHVAAFDRLLGWLLGRDAGALSTPAVVRTVGLGSTSASRTATYLTNTHGWTVEDCGDPTAWSTCLGAGVDLVVMGSSGDLDGDALVAALTSAQDGGAALVYAHQHQWNATALTAPLLDLMSLSMQGPGGPGNYFSNDAATWASAALMVADAGTLGTYKTMAQHFLDDDFTVDLPGCDGSCGGSYSAEFGNAVGALRGANDGLDRSALRLFDRPGETLHKLLVLLGDVWRAEVVFPMDKDSTEVSTFLRSYYADHATLLSRDVQAAQPDMGNFSRSDFSHIVPETVALSQVSKRPFRAATVYALPGQTFRVTRTDTEDVSVSIKVNSLRSGSTHALDAGGYVRPQYLTSPSVPIGSGETVALTWPYGGPIQVVYGSNDAAVELSFEDVGRHPVWQGPSDDAAFASALVAGEYDWAEFVTSHYEIHSTAEKMAETMAGALVPSGTALADLVETYHHGHSLALAGYQGPGIPVVDEIVEVATTNGWTVVTRDEVQHMNADQATCGSGCSGNPFDAYWAFTPVGHGDLHELGHNHERGRFKFAGREGHATTNYYSYYAKQQHFLATGLTPDCQSLPFVTLFDLLQDSFNTADPYGAVHADSSLNGWSQGAAAFIEMLMAAQEAGAVDQGWHLVGRLHLLEREFETANDDDGAWAAAKDGLGFSSFTRQEASALSNNDFLLLAMGSIAQLDYRDWFDLWGLEVSAGADAEMAGRGYPSVARVFYAAEPTGACDPWAAFEVSIDGQSLYIDLSLFPREAVDLGSTWESDPYTSAGSSVYFVALDADIGPTSGTWWGSDGQVTELNVPVVRQSDGQAGTLVVDAYQRRCSTLITLNAGRVDGCEHRLVMSVDPAKNAGLATGETWATAPDLPLLLRGWRWHIPAELIHTFSLDVSYTVP